MKRLSLFLIILIALVFPQTSQAQGSLDSVLQAVQDYFRDQYGRDYVLVEYTYALQTWSDTSLGCPQPGFSYQQETVQGYIWQLTIFDDETVYELHSNLDGSQIVLCTPIDRATLIDYRTYQNSEYLIDYPSSWQATASDDSVIISPTGNQTCTDAGIKIMLRQSIGNANTMLDDAIREAGLVQNIGVRTPVGADQSGLSTLYQGACEGNILQYRASAFPDDATSTGYLILQWTSLDSYGSWSGVFLRMLESFRTLDSLNGDSTTAADVDPARLLSGYQLAHLFVQDVYIGSFDELPGRAITIGSDHPRRSLRFSDDGRYLAYIDHNPSTGEERLDVIGTNLPRTSISSAIAPYFGVTWSGDTLAYVETHPEGLQLFSVKPTVAQTPQDLGIAPFIDDCIPFSTNYISQELYARESGPNGNSFTLEWLPDDRFLYTTRCDGSGLAIWNPTDNTSVNLGDDLKRGAIHPEQTRIVALGDNRVAYSIDLNSGERTILGLEHTPDQLAWSLDGHKIYYSNLFVGPPFVINEPSVQQRTVDMLGVFPYESQLNTVSLLEFDLDTGANRTLWQGQAFAIGRIVPAPNNAGVVFSVIPSDREYVMTFVQQDDPTALRFARPETQLYWVSPVTEEANLLAVSAQPTFAPVVVE